MISIIYLTSRKDPLLSYFCDSLARQVDQAGCSVEVIMVDYHNQFAPDGRWTGLHCDAESLHNLIDNFTIVSPKPTPWQGKYQKCKEPWFAASNSRNTGVCYAKGDYLAFVDDLTALGPQWMTQVRHARENSYLVLGAYKKVRELTVENGEINHYVEFKEGIDSRWIHGTAAGIRKFPHEGLYGCSFAVPKEILLSINGLDEICDGTSSEDTDLGYRLGRTGIPCYYNLNMLTLESEEGHHLDPSFRREARPVEGWKKPRHIENNLTDWWILYHARETAKKWTVGNNFNLREVSQHIQAGGEFSVENLPDRDWATGKLFSEL